MDGKGDGQMDRDKQSEEDRGGGADIHTNRRTDGRTDRLTD